MIKRLGATALVMLIVTSLWSQPVLRVYTNPKIPARENLDRLGLTLAWRTRLPIASQRDGLFTLQLLPAKGRTQLVVQTVFGVVYMLDAETGDLLWRQPVGIPGWNGQAVGYNDRYLFVTRRNLLYVLNRSTGAQRYYTVDKDTKLPDYGFALPGSASAAPRADEDMIFICMGNRVQAFLLPEWEAAEGSIKSYFGKELSPQERQALLEKTEALAPLSAWSYQDAGLNLEQPVLISNTQVTAASTNGNVLFLNKLERTPIHEFQTAGNIAAPMGQHGPMAYIGAEDYTLYAINAENQHLAWRFFASAPILLKPEVTDRDVFVFANRHGLYRVERATGQSAWLNPQADRFLSTNQKFVYALDRTGLLLVLDYARGTTLGRYDVRDWTMPVSNELTDRFYLASHDGQIMCLRNRAEATPLKNKTFEVKQLKLPKKEEKKEEPADMEKAKDKDVDLEKEKDKEKEKGKEKDNEKVKDAFLDQAKARTALCYSWPTGKPQPGLDGRQEAAWIRRSRMGP
jgi:outer membrane protein assembly factor BamB